MKTLIFDNDAKYELVYESLCTAQEGYKGAQTRVIAKVFDKMESIGILRPDSEVAFRLNPLLHNDDDIGYTAWTIELEDAEFDLLKKAFSSTPWTGLGAKKAAPVYDWLETIK